MVYRSAVPASGREAFSKEEVGECFSEFVALRQFLRAA
jgi:hypothetical protein